MAALQAQPVPRLTRLSPDWFQRGATNTATLEGENLGRISRFILSGGPGITIVEAPAASPTVSLETSHGGIGLATDSDRKMALQIAATPEALLETRELRVVTPGGVSNPLQLNLGYLPEIAASGANHGSNQAQWVQFPAALSGVIRETAQTHWFRFQAHKGQRLLFDVQASRYGSPLDGSLGLYDNAGKEIQRGEDDNGFDPFIDFAVPADGEYLLGLRDFRFQGGGDFRYRLLGGELPYVDYLFPMGGQRGQVVEVGLHGRNLGEVSSLRLRIAPDAPLGWQEVRARTPRGFTNARRFEVGDLPEFLEQEPNNQTNEANSVTVPVTINGRIQGEKDVDVFKFKAEKGQYLVFEVQANRFGSPLDSVLSLTDAKGLLLARNDDAAGADARLEYSFSEAGEYYVALRDLLHRDGPAYGYRLTIHTPKPDFAVRCLADTPRVWRGATSAVRVEVDRRAGFGGDVEITAEDLPPGISCAPLVITPDLGGDMLMISATMNAPLGVVPFKLKGAGVLGGRKVTRAVQALDQDRPVKEAFLAVLEALPFSLEPLTLSARVEQDQATAIEVLVRRQPGFLEEIKLSLEGFSSGREAITRSVDTGPVVLKGADTRASLSLKARMDSELGTRPIWVRAESTVAGQAVATLSRELPLTIVEFPFALANSLPRLSLTAVPTGSKSAAGEAEFSVRVSRRGWFTDDIALSIEGLPEGVSITSTNLPRNSAEAAFKLTATDKAPVGKELGFAVVGTAAVNGRQYRIRAPEIKLTINPPAETATVAETKPPPPPTGSGK